MSKSPEQIHIHQLSPLEEEVKLEAANENEPISQPLAANDNEIGLLSHTDNTETLQKLAGARERLGLIRTTTKEEILPQEESNVEEAPLIEETPEIAQESSVETLGQARSESASEKPAEAAQAAGGASNREGGEDGGDGGKVTKKSEGGGAEGKETSKESSAKGGSFIWKILKSIGLGVVAALALGLSGLSKITHSIFDYAKLGSKKSGKGGGGH